MKFYNRRPGAILYKICCAVLLCAAWSSPARAQQAFYLVTGKLFLDTVPNCLFDPAEPGVPGVWLRMVSLPSGAEIGAVTDAQVDYTSMAIFGPVTDTLLRVYVDAPANLGGGCPTVYEFALPGESAAFIADFPIGAPVCAQLDVDLGGERPRPCFERLYTVQYCNLGLAAATGAYVDVALDSALTLLGSSIPRTELPDNVWRFSIGDVASFQCGEFSILYELGCDVPVGQIVCSEARIFPDTGCLENWNGARLLAKAQCGADSVTLSVTNLSNIPSSPGLDYVIAEDIIMYQQGELQLMPQETWQLNVPANGSTWHISAEQEPGYPGGAYTNATLEGCGTNSTGAFTMGVFLGYPYTPGLLNRARDCQEAVSATPTHYLEGIPVGFGSEHLIRADDELEYRIHFQNVGSDTVFHIAVLFPVPSALEPASVSPGAASHPYTFLLGEDGAVTFLLSGVQLPDSASNPGAAAGFVSLHARPRTSTPPGTVVSSTAQIFFDDESPVTTNTIFHTVGENFITVPALSLSEYGPRLRFFPNPAVQTVYFERDHYDGSSWRVVLFDALGRPVAGVDAQTAKASLPCNQLPPGLYLFHVLIENVPVSCGRLIIH